ncbi:MAG: aminopeptidase P family protein [Proteobacteria bacterium]|nr:aminopeptidase P family protein [Pseudomonadota bacterium]
MELTDQKIEKLRKEMRQKKLSAYIVPSTDPHNSEDVADYWQARAWISGFTGSAGTVVVTMEEAGLWTDFRYFIQAEKQLSRSKINLFKLGERGVPDYPAWLAKTLKPGDIVGIDGNLFTIKQARTIESRFKKKGVILNTDFDLIGTIWNDRPKFPGEKIQLHNEKYFGLSASEKLEEVRKDLSSKGADSHLITSLDDIAWLFNIRGRDLSYCPVVIAYALITQDNAILFIDPKKIDQKDMEHLRTGGIATLDYDELENSLNHLNSKSTILLDIDQVNHAILGKLPDEVKVLAEKQPTIDLKAIKHPDEIEHYKNCQKRDAVAMVRFRIWLENEVPGGAVTELLAGEKIDSLRKEQDNFIDLSFNSIVGYGPHGAIVHYASSPETDIPIKEESFLLVDSGGQYLDGTTDITRTYCFAELSDEEKKDYTLVLKGNIRLSQIRFKAKTRGYQLEVLAREAIWSEGIDYGHGTGHGVGYFLNVHEGPQSISQKAIDAPLEPGMLVTNEPGIYRQGKHGIRLENIMLVVEDGTTEFGDFNRFEITTLVPFDLKPVIKETLTPGELEWLNLYHARIFSEISPLLTDEEKKWLYWNTRPL